MENLVDVTTTAFQAEVAVVVVIFAGYAYNYRLNQSAGPIILGVAQKVLLPALVFTTLSTTALDLKGLALAAWPLAVIALVSHLISLVFGFLAYRFGSTAVWFPEVVTLNNVTSFPLLLIQALLLLSPSSPSPAPNPRWGYKGLWHLALSPTDSPAAVVRRLTEYVVLNLLITGLARVGVAEILLRVPAIAGRTGKAGKARQVRNVEGSDYGSVDGDDEEEDDDEQGDEEEVNRSLDPARSGAARTTGRNVVVGRGQTETSPLLLSASGGPAPLPLSVSSQLASSLSALRRLLRRVTHPVVLAAVLGLLVGLIKPLQRGLVGTRDVDGLGGKGLWVSVGGGLGLLGGVYAAVDLIGVGVAVRAGEKRGVNQEIPPVLGPVLSVVAYRYFALPALMILLVRGLQKAHALHTPYYVPGVTGTAGQAHGGTVDPAFVLALVLPLLSPPSLPSLGGVGAHSPYSSGAGAKQGQLGVLSPHRSALTYHTLYLTVLLALPLAYALALSSVTISLSLDFDLGNSLRSALGGGVAGAMAMVVQVLALMPLRTVMNYQYRYGGGLGATWRKLWAEGGIRRYYAGLGAAIFQGPLSRFGDTAANSFILALLSTLTWPVLIKTVAASVASACFRMTLTPIDTLKTTQQTRGGTEGLRLLRERIAQNGIGCLWWGALATAAATFVGHYPWYGTYNYLSETLPPPHSFIAKLGRQAFIGFAASVISDTISNSLRVVKTFRQVHEKNVGYWTAAREIVAQDGIWALFGRGLGTRLLTNGLQGLLFSILWKFFGDLISKKTGTK